MGKYWAVEIDKRYKKPSQVMAIDLEMTFTRDTVNSALELYTNEEVSSFLVRYGKQAGHDMIVEFCKNQNL